MELVQSIKHLHAHLNVEQLNIQEQLTVSNIVEKKLPQTLNTYFNVKKEYRTQFKNSNGKDANELLIASLENMVQMMEIVCKDHHYNNFLKLDANTRYIDALKDSMK